MTGNIDRTKHLRKGTMCDTGAKKDTCRSIHVFQSCRKLPWLSGSTRRLFPIRETTKNKQLDCWIPHIPSISNIHTICSICANTTWHHNMTLRLKYLFNRLRGARYYKHRSHDPTFRAYKSKHKRKLSCLSTDIYK